MYINIYIYTYYLYTLIYIYIHTHTHTHTHTSIINTPRPVIDNQWTLTSEKSMPVFRKLRNKQLRICLLNESSLYSMTSLQHVLLGPSRSSSFPKVQCACPCACNTSRTFVLLPVQVSPPAPESRRWGPVTYEHMSILVYTSIYIYICIYVYMYVCTSLHIYIHILTHRERRLQQRVQPRELLPERHVLAHARRKWSSGFGEVGADERIRVLQVLDPNHHGGHEQGRVRLWESPRMRKTRSGPSSCCW